MLRWSLVISTALTSVLFAACADRNKTAPAQDAISFSHHLHSEQGLACEDCHSSISSDAEKKVPPLSMAECANCHDVEDVEGCSICHSQPDDPGTWAPQPETHILFTHARHLERSADCAECHSTAAHVPAIDQMRKQWPGHTECGTCHKKDLEGGDCAQCHDRLYLYARKPETLYSHEIDFLKKHGSRASSNEAVCASCHDQSFCTDCHNQSNTMDVSARFPDRVDRHFMHAGDWISRHALESRIGDLTCQKCHGVSYCGACHERNGVGQSLGVQNPHPDSATWMSPGPNSHSSEARKDIAECATCHDRGAASNCVTCHRSGGVNPHPPGWKSPVEFNERADHRMCAICHNN